ncbi:hypothetical protein VPH35_028879 [Triticum aestivum]
MQLRSRMSQPPPYDAAPAASSAVRVPHPCPSEFLCPCSFVSKLLPVEVQKSEDHLVCLQQTFRRATGTCSHPPSSRFSTIPHALAIGTCASSAKRWFLPPGQYVLFLSDLISEGQPYLQLQRNWCFGPLISV